MKNVIVKAKKYVLSNGTDLQKSCLNFVLGIGDKEAIVNDLKAYQNEDGGFSNGLEIEYKGPVSTPFTTAVALDYIYKFNLEDKELLNSIIEYLHSTQSPDGSWDDIPEMLKFEHPQYMGPGVYVDYKTGMILSGLQRLKIQEKEMLKKAQRYLLDNFDLVYKGKDMWSAVAYSKAFCSEVHLNEYSKIMEWCMSVLMINNEFTWQQAQGMIIDDMPIPEQAFNKTIKLINEQQQEDGGWPHLFGTYNRVWSAIFICKFILKNKLV